MRQEWAAWSKKREWSETSASSRARRWKSSEGGRAPCTREYRDGVRRFAEKDGDMRVERVIKRYREMTDVW